MRTPPAERPDSAPQLAAAQRVPEVPAVQHSRGQAASLCQAVIVEGQPAAWNARALTYDATQHGGAPCTPARPAIPPSPLLRPLSAPGLAALRRPLLRPDRPLAHLRGAIGSAVLQYRGHEHSPAGARCSGKLPSRPWRRGHGAAARAACPEAASCPGTSHRLLPSRRMPTRLPAAAVEPNINTPVAAFQGVRLRARVGPRRQAADPAALGKLAVVRRVCRRAGRRAQRWEVRGPAARGDAAHSHAGFRSSWQRPPEYVR